MLFASGGSQSLWIRTRMGGQGEQDLSLSPEEKKECTFLNILSFGQAKTNCANIKIMCWVFDQAKGDEESVLSVSS